MTDLKGQWICIKFRCKLSKTALETHRMLKEAFGDSALCQTQIYEWFKRFKSGWMSVLDDLQPEPYPKIWLKCERLS